MGNIRAKKKINSLASASNSPTSPLMPSMSAKGENRSNFSPRTTFISSPSLSPISSHDELTLRSFGSDQRDDDESARVLSVSDTGRYPRNKEDSRLSLSSVRSMVPSSILSSSSGSSASSSLFYKPPKTDGRDKTRLLSNSKRDAGIKASYNNDTTSTPQYGDVGQFVGFTNFSPSFASSSVLPLDSELIQGPAEASLHSSGAVFLSDNGSVPVSPTNVLSAGCGLGNEYATQLLLDARQRAMGKAKALEKKQFKEETEDLGIVFNASSSEHDEIGCGDSIVSRSTGSGSSNSYSGRSTFELEKKVVKVRTGRGGAGVYKRSEGGVNPGMCLIFYV